MTPGIYPKVSMREYLTLKALSSGLIHTLLTQSPFHARHEQENPGEPSAVSEIGTAIHDALLEGIDRIAVINPEDHRSKPNKNNPEGAIPVGWTNNAIRAARDTARAAGLIPMLPDAVTQVTGAVQAAKDFLAKSELRGVFDSGDSELTVVSSEAGFLMKIRPDWLQGRALMLHLKTTEGSAAPGAFARTVDNMGYDLSVAYYERVLASVTGVPCRSVILAVEQNAPYGCALYDLDPAKSALAAARVQRAITIWQKCEASGKWPSYDTRVHSLEPKPWDLAAEEAVQIGGAYDALTAGEL